MTKTTSLKLWIAGARLRTLPLAFAPVAAGTGVASVTGGVDWLLATLALLVSLFLQVGVNYANDYSDGIRGTDKNRVGPLRLTGSGSAKPEAVKFAAFGAFGVAAVTGLVIVVLTQQWWMVFVGLMAILAAWFYTGGKSPYGYSGLGEIAVFVFFGLVATVGTSFIQTLQVSELAVLSGIGVGLYATAVLLVNNIRDIETDKLSNKRTIAVVMGPKISKLVYLVMVWLPLSISAFLFLLFPATILSTLVLLLLFPITLIVSGAPKAKDLITALKLTSYAGLVYGLGLGFGFWIS
jgi:1,4-dihydroxy-2-naphthoate octaprenyltransferase